jgi:uncharacterized hydrophobic protein (TIGR00271 family)
MKNSIHPDIYTELRDTINDYSKCNTTYILMNFFAASITVFGLLADNSGVVVAAMIIAMIYGPIPGISFSLVKGDKNLLIKSLLTLLLGILIVLSTSFILGLVFKNILISNAVLALTKPSLFDLLISLTGGAAGTYAVLSTRFGLPFLGVPIATSIVPPLASCGILLSHGEISLAYGALFLTLTNIVAIQVSGTVIMWARGLRRAKDRYFIIPNILDISILLILGTTLTLNIIDVMKENIFEGSLKNNLEMSISKYPGNYLVEFKTNKTKLDITVRAVIRGPKVLTFEQVGEIEDKLKDIDKSMRLIVRYVPVTILTRNEQLFTKEK